MVNPNRDEIIVAELVKDSYDKQIALGTGEPILSEAMAESTYSIGGVWLEELATHGLRIATYSLDGPTYIEPISAEGEQNG